MNVFKPIPHDKTVETLQAMSPVSQVLGFDPLRSLEKASAEESIRFLRQSPRYLFTLGEQYFYRNTCGEQNGIRSVIFADIGSLKAAAVCKYLFRRVFIDEILLRDGRTVWGLSIKEIREEGIRAFEEVADTALRKLYHAEPANDMQLGIYRVTVDSKYAQPACSTILTETVKNPLFCSMDVSSLTVRQCAENPMIAHIAAHASDTFLSVERLPTGQCCKVLLWRLLDS